jgi:hypothetical protein
MNEIPQPLVFPLGLDTLAREADVLEHDASALLEGLTDPQANWRPSPGAWSIAQCVDHLAVTQDAYLAAIESVLAGAPRVPAGTTPTIVPGRPALWFIRQMEPPVRMRFPAPKKIVPAPSRTPGEVERAFRASLDRLRHAMHAASRLDVNRVRFPNPFAPIRFTVGTGMAVMVAHDRRHLWQAWGVRRTPGFPA